MNGIKVLGASIISDEGVSTSSERGEEIRQTVNRWIHAKDNFDDASGGGPRVFAGAAPKAWNYRKNP
jgi:hypothetical protein